MSTKADIQQSKLRFTKWSRKSYAAFLTIGKEVTIGFLAVQLCLRLGLKSAVNSVDQTFTLYSQTEDEEFSDENSALFFDFSILLFLLGWQPQLSTEISSHRYKSHSYFSLFFLPLCSLQKILFSLSSALDFKPLLIKFLKPMYKNYLWAAIAVSFFKLTSAQAQEVDTIQNSLPNVTIDEVVIRENRMDYTLKNVPKNMDIMTKKEMKSLAVQSVPELLSYQSGIDLRQRGPMGVQSDLRINGGTFEQSLVLLNGVKLTDPQSGHHLMNLPLEIENLERVEVIKGAATKRYGQNAFGGAVNFVTKVPDSNFIQLKVYGGDFETKGGNAAISFNKNKQHHYLSLGGDFSEGYRHNTDFQMLNAFYQGEFDIRKEESLNLILGLSDRKFGANGFYATPTATEQYEEIMTAFGIVSYDWQKNNWKIMPRLSWRFNNDQYDFIRQQPEIYRNDHSTQSMSAELHITNNNKWGQSGMGVEHRLEMIEGDWLRGGVASPSNLDGFERSNTSLYLEHKFEFLQKRLLFSPGLYASWFSHFDGAFFPALEASYLLAEEFNLFANLSKSYRVPTFYDQYYESPVESGNPNLHPEEAWSYEGGLRFQRNSFRSSIAVFQRNNEDLIDWVWDREEEKWLAQNYNQLVSRGLDASVEYLSAFQILGDNIKVAALKLSYFKMEQVKTEEGQADSRYVLDYVNDQLIGRLTLSFYKRLSLNIAYRYINRMKNTPYQLLDAKAVYQLPNYSFFVEASNISNTDYVEVMTPMPGRWFRAGVSLKVKY